MKKLIVNADDLGLSEGVNEGIIKAYRDGIVTSTSLMVRAQSAGYGVKLANKNPHLGLGLHFQIENDDLKLLWQTKKVVAAVLIEKTKKEFLEQVKIFERLTGRLPDHIDSHHHAHKTPRIYPFIKSWCDKNKVPFRMQVNLIDSFFGIPSLERISIDSLITTLKNLPDGISELMCHPGILTPDVKSSYSEQRELELKSLTSHKVKLEVKRLGIELISWEGK